jgi:polyisoprenoid-binding protein YceI
MSPRAAPRHDCGMSLTRALAPLVVAIAAASQARGQTAAELIRSAYDADTHHSMVEFTVRIFGGAKVRGRFRDYAATAIYDPAHIERASVTAVIKTESIDTDMEFRDKHLKSPDFFDVATYPTIEFQSDRVERTSDGYRAIGRFTMHGVTRTIALPFSVLLEPATRGASGTTSGAFEISTRLSRKDFGIAGTNKFNLNFDPATALLSDSVDVTIDLVMRRPGYLTWSFTGQKPPSIADTIGRVLASRGATAAVRQYRVLRQQQPTVFDFSAYQLDAFGHQLLDRGQTNDAIAMLSLNDEMYPTADGVTTSLAGAYARAGNDSLALATYRRALQVDSLDTSSIEMVRHLTH